MVPDRERVPALLRGESESSFEARHAVATRKDGSVSVVSGGSFAFWYAIINFPSRARTLRYENQCIAQQATVCHPVIAVSIQVPTL